MSKEKIEQNVYRHGKVLIQEKGYISPIDLLIKMERVTPKQVNDWRLKKIPNIESVTVGNLSKINHILKTLQKFAKEQNLKPSMTIYKSWGKGPKKTLQFSKKGNAYIEEVYSTHYVGVKPK
ncbi:hypothetical protein [Alkalibacillus haloalkaliphilus]|uniref:hypothetical protein n=1 Tax=Alkalibacillus haloalkaliphilus TaxID=94136 RepID=UPI0003115CF0|nr:hypothetical protein [Alkalibacillus haloalkaliphilus]